MALRNETAQAWIGLAAIGSILNAISLFIMGLGMPILMATTPDYGSAGGSLGALIAMGVVLGIILIGIAILLWFVGIGAYNFRSWSRIALIIFGWLGVAVSLLILLAGFVMMAIGSTGDMMFGSTLGTTSMVVGALVILVGILCLVCSGIHLYLFQFEPTIRSLLTATSGNALQIDDARAPMIVRSFGLRCFIGAIVMLLVVAVTLIATIAIGVGGEATGAVIMAVLTVALFAIAALIYLLGKGLWNLRSWARTVILVLLGVGAVLTVVYAILQAVSEQGIAAGIVTLASGIATIAFEVWLFTRDAVKRAMGGGGPTNTSDASASKVAVKGKAMATSSNTMTPASGTSTTSTTSTTTTASTAAVPSVGTGASIAKKPVRTVAKKAPKKKAKLSAK